MRVEWKRSMIGKVTKRTVEALSRRNASCGTRRLSGLVSGANSATLLHRRYRWHGAQRIDSIGRHGPGLRTPPGPRPYVALRLVAAGVDPREPKGEYVSDLVERYLEAKGDLRPYYEATRYLRTVAEPLHGRAVAIDRREVAALLADVEAEAGARPVIGCGVGYPRYSPGALRRAVADNPVTGTGTRRRND